MVEIEKEAFAPRASRWKIAGAGNHRQFRCCCPLESRKRNDSAAGIDSWQRVVRPRYSYHLHDSKYLAQSSKKGDRAVAIFSMFDGLRARSVSMQIDENGKNIVDSSTGGAV